MEKQELSKIDFELIDDAFKALLQSRPDPIVADKVADLQDKFRDALIRNVKGEYDTGTIIQIDENTTGDDDVEEMFSKALIDFCKRAGYTDISQAN